MAERDFTLRDGKEVGRLDEENATKFSDAIRGQMKMSPGSYSIMTETPQTEVEESDHFHYGPRKGGYKKAVPSPEDYQKAYEAIEELKNVSAKETDSERFKLLVKRSALKLGHKLGKIFIAVMSVDTAAARGFDPEHETTKARLKAVAENSYQERLVQLESAAKKLRDLEKRGKKWSKWERSRLLKK